MARDYASLADYGTTSIEDYVHVLPLQSSGYLSKADITNSPTHLKRRHREAIEIEDEAIESEIKASKFILAIEPEDEDANFLKYDSETWSRAVHFLRRLTMHTHSCGFSGIGVPEILPADGGAISLFWRGEKKQLLMTFPAEPEKLVSFYGKSKDRDLAGRFPSNDFTPELAYWLTN